MSGLIAIPAQESARFTMFAASLTDLDMPDGWEVAWRFGWDLADSHNALIETALAKDKDWIWFMADDHAFSPNLLRKLLAHDLDMVIPVCLMRNAPYRPVNWVAADLGPASRDADRNEYDEQGRSYEQSVKRIDLNDYPDGGLVEVVATGAAGLLVKRHVFDKVPEPWFEAGTKPGKAATARVGEDINFCRKAREAGFQIFMDLDSVLGHCSTTVVWPVHEPDGWTFGFSMMGGFKITMPPGFQAYADECGR